VNGFQVFRVHDRLLIGTDPDVTTDRLADLLWARRLIDLLERFNSLDWDD